MKKEPLDSYIRVRLSESEKRKLKSLSDESNISMSDLVRQKIFSTDEKSIEQFTEEKQLSIERIQKLADIEKEVAKTQRGVSGMMNNYNQLMRRVNTEKEKQLTDHEINYHSQRIKYMSKQFDELRERIDKLWQSRNWGHLGI